MSDEQVLEHFKEKCPKIEVKLLQTDDLHAVIGKARVLVHLFTSELPQPVNSTISLHMTEGEDNNTCAYITNRGKLNTYHKAHLEEEQITEVYKEPE